MCVWGWGGEAGQRPMVSRWEGCRSSSAAALHCAAPCHLNPPQPCPPSHTQPNPPGMPPAIRALVNFLAGITPLHHAITQNAIIGECLKVALLACLPPAAVRKTRSHETRTLVRRLRLP